jgi:isoleucyl-tRNA synthetase
MSFSCEEVWQYLPKLESREESVHLALFPEPEELTAGFDAAQRKRLEDWEKLIAVRDDVLKALEAARQKKFIGANLEARVRLKADEQLYPLLEKYLDDLPGLLIVSQVSLEHASGALAVEVERADGEKCERCWKYTADVGRDPEFPTICAACREAVQEMLGE